MNLKKFPIKYFITVTIFFLMLYLIYQYKIVDQNHLVSDYKAQVEYFKNIANKTKNKKIKNLLLLSEEYDTIKLSSLITSKKLVFMFSELHCDSCINNEFENINLNLDNLKDELVIIGKYSHPKYLHLFKRLNKLQDLKIYNLIDDEFDVLQDLEETNIPYFIYLNSDLIIETALVPLKAFNNRTIGFLNDLY